MADPVSSNNDNRTLVRFLCSFSGNILPRPHDGKLRYVGGETRIVSIPRDVTYEELMVKMKELFDGAMVLKYQQSDEDLDILVSVVNDEDVTNMMEEYDKLGAVNNGLTRLRFFLFSYNDMVGSAHFVDGDERDNERRYVDALNSLNESAFYLRSQINEAQFCPVDDGHVALTEKFFNKMSLDGGLCNQHITDINMPPINLRQLTIPHLISSQSFSQMESPWSPAYYSPKHPSVLEPQVAEFPTPPSSGRYRAHYAEVADRTFDCISEEHKLHNQNQSSQSLYEHQQQYTDNVPMYMPPVPSEKSGFPQNFLHNINVFEENSRCNKSIYSSQKNQPYPESFWQPGDHQHVGPQSLGNWFHQVDTPFADCPPNWEKFMLKDSAGIHYPYYPGKHNDSRLVYNGNHIQKIGWNWQHQLTPRAELGPHASGVGRDSDHYIADNKINISHGLIGASNSQYVPLHLFHIDDPPIRARPEVGSHIFHDPALASLSNMHVQPLDEHGIGYAGASHAVKADGIYQAAHAHAPLHALWRNVQSPMQGGTSYEASVPPLLNNGLVGPGFVRVEGSQKLQSRLENHNVLVKSSPKPLGLGSSPVLEFLDGETRQSLNAYNNENLLLHIVDTAQCPSDMLNFAALLDPSVTSNSLALVDDNSVLPATAGAEPVNTSGHGVDKEAVCEGMLEPSSLGGLLSADQKLGSDDVGIHDAVNATLVPVVRNSGPTKAGESDNNAPAPVTVGCVDEVKSGSKANGEPDAIVNKDAHGDIKVDSDCDNSKSKIELTKAEEKALSSGLQVIKHEDLEEIRELGTGTYGAVYHGKWKGSDVAIKRIKASCFAGRLSERERLISDFWKEALILSSLHHPNVVSFYGVVRDGPDGSLATVTEFMVNGSLKQFLQKKDRTIDRRKRVMLAMDTAFGMEYLHGKSIVHFDLKCENLLVNMRDPHRPVCKIGDLGLSKVKQNTQVSGGVRGTLPWMAPELLREKSSMVTEKIDVYSFGVVMWELLTGDEPYKDMRSASIIDGIVNRTLCLTIPTWCDPEWKSLMEICWAADPALRPSFTEISQKLRNMAAAMNLK